ncbi:DUF4395 domain-containing protein [Fodinibacter luteus]|uniref:DUF4395 domain-containing protein n=1 Tax=Fodinibacter luteus TaxID=552064 RepID=A0ABP8KNR1_9MICO
MASVRISFEFPAVVNEKAARTVAGGVALVSALALVTGWLWLAALLAVGFALRVAFGPRRSVIGWIAADVVAPRLGTPKRVPGPPKRFAQAVGLALTLTATVFLAAGLPVVTTALLAVLLIFASLEAVVGFCAGCYVFGLLMRVGLVPEETCAACNDISLRRRETAAA